MNTLPTVHLPGGTFFTLRPDIFVLLAPHFSIFVPDHGTSVWYICVPLQVAEGRFSSRSDVWSIGVCVYAILCGQMPFETPDNTMLKKRDARALLTDITMTHPRWDEVSDTCKDLVR